MPQNTYVCRLSLPHYAITLQTGYHPSSQGSRILILSLPVRAFPYCSLSPELSGAVLREFDTERKGRICGAKVPVSFAWADAWD